MKYYVLDKEEREILEAVEKGKFKSVPNLKEEKKRLQVIAGNTLNKTRNINLRLSERDVQKLKAKAVKQGIPYQTLASSILHQSASE